jgi:hypothetical protein
MSSSVDRPTGSRPYQSKSASVPSLRWPPEQGRKPPPETNVERGAPADHPAFKRNRLDAENIVNSNVPESAPREEPVPAISQRAPKAERPAERLLQDPFIIESLRQLALAMAIVLVLGFVSLRIFSLRETSVVGAANEGAGPAASSNSLTIAPKRPWAPTPPAPKLEVDFDRSAPAGRPTPLRLTVGDAPEGSTIVISGLGPGATLSAGEDRDVEWRLGLADLSNLSVAPPKDFVGTMVLVVELRLPDGGVGGRQIIRLEWTGEAAAEAQNQAAQASLPPPSAPSETPLAATVTPEAAPAAESVKEKQVARAAPQQDEAPAQAEAPVKEAVAAPAEPDASEEARVSPCFAKLDGKVVLQGNCRIVWTERKSVTFESGEKRLSITLDHGRVWRLNWNGQDKGKIYKRDDCWGSEKAYVCQHKV